MWLKVNATKYIDIAGTDNGVSLRSSQEGGIGRGLGDKFGRVCGTPQGEGPGRVVNTVPHVYQTTLQRLDAKFNSRADQTQHSLQVEGIVS